MRALPLFALGLLTWGYARYTFRVLAGDGRLGAAVSGVHPDGLDGGRDGASVRPTLDPNLSTQVTAAARNRRKRLPGEGAPAPGEVPKGAGAVDGGHAMGEAGKWRVDGPSADATPPERASDDRPLRWSSSAAASSSAGGAAGGAGMAEEEEEAAGGAEEEEEEEEEEAGGEAGDGQTGRTKCACVDGRAENCRSLEPGRGVDAAPNPRELVIAAVCGIAKEAARLRRVGQGREDDRRRAREDPQVKRAEAVKKPWFVRKEAGDVMRIGGSNGDKWLREFFTEEERAHAAAVNALEMRAAVAILRAVPHLLRPTSRDLLDENVFYSAANHLKLRDKKDPFRNDSLPLLPGAAPVLRYPTCAVVGSSGVMIASGLGQQIDAHRAVVRLNQAPCQARYQPDVGARTTLRILNKRWTAIYGRHHPELMHVDPDAKEDRGGRMTVVASRCNVAEYKKLGQSAAKLDPPVPTLFLASRIASHAGELLSVFRRGMTEALGRKYRGGTSPSSGFLAVFLMLQWCGRDKRDDGVGAQGSEPWRPSKVGVYGFSADECRKAGCVNSYHYFNNFIDSPWLRAHPSHSFELEGIALQALSAAGEICYVTNSTGKCAGRGLDGHPAPIEAGSL